MTVPRTLSKYSEYSFTQEVGKSKFPKVFVETSYEQPYFKTKVAAYRTKLEAKKALKVYKSAFRSAFIFEDKVSIDKL